MYPGQVVEQKRVGEQTSGTEDKTWSQQMHTFTQHIVRNFAQCDCTLLITRMYVCKTATSKAYFILCKHISTCKCYFGTSLLTKTIPLSLKDFNVHLFILSHVFHCTGKSKLETFMRKVYLNIHLCKTFSFNLAGIVL